jgi:NADPH-dependent curcumin reductase
LVICLCAGEFRFPGNRGGSHCCLVLRKRLLLRGFIVSDFAAKQGDFLRDVGEWVRTGRIKYREDIVGGLEKAPASFLGVLQGKHFGKMLVRMAT